MTKVKLCKFTGVGNLGCSESGVANGLSAIVQNNPVTLNFSVAE